MNILLKYETFFRRDLKKVIPHIVSSLNKIALPLTSTAENRSLSIALVELLISWDTLLQEYVAMNLKDDDERLYVTSTNYSHESISQVLDKNQVDVVANFIVRFLLSMSNVDSADKNIIERANKCFHHLLHRWPTTDIRYVYFDKIVALCSNHSYLEVLMHPDFENHTGKKASDKSILPSDDLKNSPSVKAYSSKDIATEHFLPTKLDQPKSLSNPIITACIDIFLAMIQCSPPHSFLSTYSKKIKDCMKPFFSQALSNDGKEVLIKLKRFLMSLLNARSKSSAFQPYLDTVNTLVESAFSSMSAHFRLFKSTQDSNKTYTAEVTFQVLSGLEYLGEAIAGFPDVYIYSIMNVSEVLLSEYFMSCTSSRSPSNLGHYTAVSPTVAIIEEAINDHFASVRHQQGSSQEKEATEYNKGNRFINCLVCCIRMAGRSQVLYRFSELRAKLLSMLMQILEKAEDLKLIVSVCIEIAKTLSRERADQLFTREEKRLLVTRIKALYHRSFSDTKSQMLFHLISFMVVELKVVTHSGNLFPERGTIVELNQALMGSLLSTNVYQRSLAAARILSEISFDKVIPKELDLSHYTYLFKQDFEAIGNRFVPFAIAELLCTVLSKEEKNPDIDMGSSFSDSVYDWSSLVDDNIHTSFLSFNKHLFCKHQDAMNAIKVLLSSSPELCQDFLECYIGRSWIKAGAQSRSEFAQAILGLMSQMYHSQFLRRPHLYKTGTYIPSRSICRNSVWSFATILSKLSPVPSVDSIILFPIASHYNCFHEIKRFVFICRR